MIRSYGAWIFATLLGLGSGLAGGALLTSLYGGSSAPVQKLWATGATLIVLGGVWYLSTRRKWDV